MGRLPKFETKAVDMEVEVEVEGTVLLCSVCIVAGYTSQQV